jgi:hypothetical protein
MKVGELVLQNEEKVNRALEGSMSERGLLKGGLKKLDNWNKMEDKEKDFLLLAEYDRLGGLILKGELKVKTGCFYDFNGKKPYDKPVISFEAMSDDGVMELSEDEAKALKKVEKKKKELKEKKKKKLKK